MGAIRNLTADEIVVQFYYARQQVRRLGLPSIANVVFMGMGEPTDNAQAVQKAISILTTRALFQLSATKVTLSTVAPTPDVFEAFSQTPCVLAWSVHAARDVVRRRLVPTTRYTMNELCDGLIKALKERPVKLRTTMWEVVLIDSVNDSMDDADALADLANKLTGSVPGCKLMINLIPYNDIGHASDAMQKDIVYSHVSDTYRRPSPESVRTFQNRLWSHGIYAHVRSTRGDDETAACGQLVTASSRNQVSQQT
jgi:23S rRNA (adenine2503-C2)-methyltransferase